MNKIKYLLGIIFLCIGIYNFRNYRNFKNSLAPNAEIIYKIINKKVNNGGRGDSYEMKIEYNNKEYSISLTSKEFVLIDSKIYPTLYESKNTGKIFSKWIIKKSGRISILFIILFFVAVLPWRSVFSKFNLQKRNSL